MSKPVRKNLLTLFRRNKVQALAAHDEHEDGCAALCCAHAGQKASVIRFEGDAVDAARLRDLGLREGALVTVVRDGDPLIVKVDDARFGIGRAAAMQILCALHESNPHANHPRRLKTR